MDSKRYKILVIDDDEVYCSFVYALLAGEKYQVFTEIDGQKAIARIQEVNPDVILLDIRMPIIDGYEICRQIRVLNTPNRLVIIIMVSALMLTEEKQKAFESGANDYIVKPYSKKEIIDRIENLLILKEIVIPNKIKEIITNNE